MSHRRKHRKPRIDWADAEVAARAQLDRNRRLLEDATWNGTPQAPDYRKTIRRPVASAVRLAQNPVT